MFVVETLYFRKETFHDFKSKENQEFYHEGDLEGSVVGAIINPNDRGEELVNADDDDDDDVEVTFQYHIIVQWE